MKKGLLAGTPRRSPPPPPPPPEVRPMFDGETLDDARARLIAAIDADAENVRMARMTPGVGMAKVHEQKLAEAQIVQAMGYDVADALSPAEAASRFPMLSVSVGVEAGSLSEIARIVIGKHERFVGFARSVEQARIAAKTAVRSAATVDAARAAYSAVKWPAG